MGTGTESIGNRELGSLCLRALKKCQAADAHLWGLNVTSAGRNMTLPGDEPRTSCGLVNGGCFGLQIRSIRSPGQVELHGVADDAARTAKNFHRDGVILRFGGYALPFSAFEHATKAGTSSQVTANLARKGQKRKLNEKKAAKSLGGVFPELLKFDASVDGLACFKWKQKRGAKPVR